MQMLVQGLLSVRDCAVPVKGNLTQPETLKKFAHVSFRKFLHLVQIVVNG